MGVEGLPPTPGTGPPPPLFHGSHCDRPKAGKIAKLQKSSISSYEDCARTRTALWHYCAAMKSFPRWLIASILWLLLVVLGVVLWNVITG